MSGRFDLGLERLASRWERSHGKFWAPYIGIVGPRGCGKTDFLEELRAFRHEAREDQNEKSISVDLRTIGVGSEPELYSRLNEAIRKLTGVTADFLGAGGRDPGLAFEGVLRAVLEDHQGLVTLYLDSLECVPRAFARSLSRRFRIFWERRGEDIFLQRLGLVFAGGLSVFELKQESDSAFPLSEIVNLGEIDRETRERIVRKRLDEVQWEAVTGGLVSLLVDETGGEPAFFYPVIQAVSGGRNRLIVDEASVRSVCEDIEWLMKGVPVIEDLCIWYWNEERVRSVVERLSADESEVRPSGLVADIDPIELTGVALLKEIHGAKIYEFRNRMVERFFREVSQRAILGDRRVWRGSAAAGRNGGAGWVDSPCMEKVVRLDELHRKAADAETVRDLMVLVAEVWRTLGGGEAPRFCTSVVVPRRGAWVSRDGGWRWVPRDAEEWRSRWCLSERVFASGGSSVASSGKEVIFAIPVSRGSGQVVLFGSAMATVWEGAFGIGAGDQWRCWIRRIEKSLVFLSLAEVGRDLLLRGVPWNDATPVVSEARAAEADAPLRERLRALPERIRATCEVQVRKSLRATAVLVIFASVGGSALWARDALAFAKDNFKVIEPAALLVSAALTVVAAVAGFLGFSIDRARAHRRLVDALVRRGVERRLRRAHLKELAEAAAAGEADDGTSPASG